MISYLMTRQNHKLSSQVKQFLPNTRFDLSLNLPKEFEREVSSDGSVGLALSFRSSSDSIFTSDQEEYLASSVDSTNENKLEEHKENMVEIPNRRTRERKYNDSYTKSPTPTKYYELLAENQKIVDEYR